jgi:ankyrin repeat protein
LETPLHLAVFRQHLPTIKVLVSYSVEKNQKNVVRRIKKGQSPLDLARLTSNQEIINLIEEWNLRSATIRSATMNVVDIN